MLNFDKFGQVAVSALGSLVLTITLVGAAVGPARAIETTPIVASAVLLSVQSHA